MSPRRTDTGGGTDKEKSDRQKSSRRTETPVEALTKKNRIDRNAHAGQRHRWRH